MILVQNIIRIDSVESTRELKYFLHPPRIIWINKSTRFVPEFVGGQLAQLVELDLLGEDIERNVDRATEPATTLVIVKYRVEGGPIPIEEVLVAKRIEVSDTPMRIAKERVRKLIQRTQLRLKP